MNNFLVKKLASALLGALVFSSPIAVASQDFAGSYTIEMVDHQNRALHIAADHQGQWLYNDQAHLSELWQKNSRGELTLLRVFHDLKFSLFYTPSDLPGKAIEQDPLLSSLLHGCDGAEVTHAGKSEQFDNTSTLSCQRGSLKVVWLPEKGLPLSIIGTNLSMVLTKLDPFDMKKKRAELEHYEEMDFVDIGDNESHPALKKLGHDRININTYHYFH